MSDLAHVDPTPNTQQLFAQAVEWHRHGEFAQALEAYETVLSLQPDHGDALVNMGSLLKQMGRLEDAITTQNHALTLQPNRAELWFNLGNTLQAKGDIKAAESAFRKAINLQPQLSAAHFNLGRLLQSQQQLEAAAESYGDAIAYQPGLTRAHLSLGTVLTQLGKLDQAVERYRDALVLEPDNAEAYYRLGNIHVARGKWGGAISAYQQALQLRPDWPDAKKQLQEAIQHQSQASTSRKVSQPATSTPSAGPKLSTPTSMSEVQWPALPSARAARLVTLLQQLEQSQWWSAERLLGHQFQQLQVLLAHAYRTVPHYREQVSHVGPLERNRLTPSTWRKLPILTRKELQANSERFLSQQTPTGHQAIDTVSTSGSTGRPVTVHTTAITQLFWQVFALREHQWHQRDLTQTLASIRLFPKGHPAFRAEHRIESWGAPASLIYQTGPTVMFDLQTDIEQQLTWLQQQNPEYLLTFPSNAAALAQLCQQRQITLPNLREIRTVSEVVDQQVRNLCQQAWNAKVTDVYSSQEVGYIALQCPQHEHYHIQSENIYVEILDEDGRPCAPGEVGRVVVTPLHNFAMPLLRYDIGDYAEVGEPCPCRRGLPVLKRILGRVRNMLVLPTGERKWPILGEQRYAQIAPAIQQHQMIQRDLEHIEMRFVVERPLTQAEEEKLRQFILSSQLRHPFQLSFSYPDKIGRSASGKFEEFLCQIP